MTMTAPNGLGAPGPALAPKDDVSAAEAMALVRRPSDEMFRFGLEPQSLDQAMALAEKIAKSGLWAPKEGPLKPEQVLMRLMVGRNLGVPVAVAMEHVFDIYGRTSISAKLKHALTIRMPECERFELVSSDETHATWKVKRRGQEEKTFTFKIEDAQRAGLCKPDSNWLKWPRRMCQARSRAEASDTVFPDAALGLPAVDEIDPEPDPREMRGEVVSTTPPAVRQRDWPAEIAALKGEIEAAYASDSAEPLEAVKTKIRDFSAIAPADANEELKRVYAAARAAAKKRATAGAEPTPTT